MQEKKQEESSFLNSPYPLRSQSIAILQRSPNSVKWVTEDKYSESIVRLLDIQMAYMDAFMDTNKTILQLLKKVAAELNQK
jgi:hypothetical protein